MTIDSPSTVGSVATRMSSIRPAEAAFSEIRPSCGLRRSAMSSFASTFRRVVTPGASRLGIRCISWSTPSIRKRTSSESSCGSKWTSEAPSSAAWKMTELTSRTSGASETPSSASRSVTASSSTSSATAASARLQRLRLLAERLLGANDAADLQQDVVARGDRELDRVARREPQLVHPVQVRRVGDARSGARRRRGRTGSRPRARAHARARASPPPRRRPRRPDRRAAAGAAPRTCARRLPPRRSPPRRARPRASPSAARARARPPAGRPGSGVSPRAGRRGARPTR